MNRKARRQRARRGAGTSGASGANAALTTAVRHHQAGQLQQAEVLYRQVLAAQPDNPDALHLLGVVAYQVGRHDAAIDLIRRAIAGNRRNRDYHRNLGNALHRAERHEEAVAAYRRAIALAPDDGEAHNSLGGALQAMSRHDDAIAAFRRAIDIGPEHVAAHSNLGVSLCATGKPDAAIAVFHRALELRPDYAEVLVNLGAALKDMGRYEEAIATLRRALEIRPGDAEAYGNLGGVLNDLGRTEDALAQYDRVLSHCPDNVDALCNRAVPLLTQGRIEEGWRAYEHRLRKREAQRTPVAAPAWDGGPLSGKTILVRAEQGIGDEILFASCLPDLIARAGHCVIECTPRLEPLFARSFHAATVFGRARNDADWLAGAPPIDVHVMLGSLMRHFRPGLESFPDHDGYLVADATARTAFADRVAALDPGLKVGVSWRSMRDSRWQASYSALADWRGILDLNGAHFINLQYDEPGIEVSEINKEFGVQIHDFAELDLLDDLDGVAALISSLDMVIAPANTVAALAGALGVPVRLLALEPNWCMLGTAAYPWFPSATVCRRPIGADGWGQTLDDVARDLGELAGLEGNSARRATR